MKIYFLIYILAVASGKTFTKCSLAQELVRDGVFRKDVHHWVCMAEHESGLATSVVNVNADGSANHGIFQINDFWDCKPSNDRVSRNSCIQPCSAFQDEDLKDDVICIKQKLQERHQGFVGISYGYQQYCNGNVAPNYLNGCSY
ncbi:hypothetical protein SNE40_014566 [Patella caerulea]|uniref:lysozyme n=1 Tax=Patella caerulea TaxID=87958 RepID=A0AAN8PHH5_PATCE